MKERMQDEGLEMRARREDRDNLMQGYVYSEEQSESERLREERRTKKRNDPLVVRVSKEFEIGVNLVQEEGNGSPNEGEVMRLRVKRKEKRCGAGPQEHALGQVLLYHMESYKELTCEF
ncbi:unnamed protein product [Microthlaspi erraticum]|uniref:Uncharacterized protein n=1 Tax=Microthlaspi erraticum TaxID=1685480 RepID=A0A6D2I861_9BRAS|nr:unnamed protein product [Microthlaspi erraticum]